MNSSNIWRYNETVARFYRQDTPLLHMKLIGTGSRKYCEGTDITRGFVPSLKFRLLAIVYQDLEDTAYVYDSSSHNKKKQHVQDFDSYRLKDQRQRRPSSNLTTTLYESNLWDAWCWKRRQQELTIAIRRSTPIHAKWYLDQMPLRGVRPDVFHFNAAIAVHATTIESLFIEDTLSSSTKHSIHNPISNSSRKCNPRTRSIDQPY